MLYRTLRQHHILLQRRTLLLHHILLQHRTPRQHRILAAHPVAADVAVRLVDTDKPRHVWEARSFITVRAFHLAARGANVFASYM